MTKKIEETLDLPPLAEALAEQGIDENYVEDEDSVDLPANAEDFSRSLMVQEERSTEVITDRELREHDRDMDTVAKESMKAYQDLIETGMSVEAKHASNFLESAVEMLKIHMTAKQSKVERRLKLARLQLDRERFEWNKGANAQDGDFVQTEEGSFVGERNALLSSMDDD